MFPYSFGISGSLSGASDLQYILKTLQFFEELVRQDASEQRIPVEILRVLKPCRGCVILSKDAFFCVLVYVAPDDPGATTLHTEDCRPKKLDIKEAERIGIRYLLRNRTVADPLTLRFPIECMDGYAEKKQDLLLAIVQKYLVFEVSWAKQRGLLTVPKPFFPGRHFTLDPDLVFIVMPFAVEFEEVYRDCVKPTVEQFVSQCIRADDLFHNKPIMEIVWQYMNKAALIVADLTGRNPNVFYEVGIAHTLGKEVVLITQNMDDVPFDLRHLNVITYKWTPSGANKLKVALAATIKGILAREGR